MRTADLAGAAILAALGAGPAQAHHQQLVLQLKWVMQAQFAGYYVADYQGFYDEAEVAVVINPGGLGIAPTKVLADGGANIIVDWMPSALASREKGLPLVNIGQPFKRSGMELTCRRDTGIKTPADLKGRTLGIWPGGDGYPLLAWMAKLGLRTDGSPDGVRTVEQAPGVDVLVHKQADCISTMSYSEHWQLVDAGLKPDDLVVFGYEDQGAGTMEDGLYVMEDVLKDPDYVLTLAAFLHATMRGWQWARENPVEAARIVQEYDFDKALTEKPQVRMMEGINQLTEGSDGALDPADYERTVATLLSGGTGPVITKPPVGAWTHIVSDAAELGEL
jgi:NitT/TauT family transport system substrate-binding protein